MDDRLRGLRNVGDLWVVIVVESVENIGFVKWSFIVDMVLSLKWSVILNRVLS